MLDKKKQTGLYQRKYLANANVQWFSFDLNDLNQMDFNEDDQQEFSLVNGDLLVCEGGEIGRCAVWREEINDCYFQKAIHRVRCNTEMILPEYLAHSFFYHSQKNGFADIVSSKATIAHLPGDKLKAMGVIVPPIELQQQFVSFVEQSDKSKFTVGRRFKSQFIERFEGQGYAVVKAKTFMTNMRNGVSPSKKGLHAEKVLTLSAVTQGAFDPEAWKDGIFDECPPADKRIHTSEFYMCRGNGNKMLVGTAVFSPEDHDDLVFPDTVIAAHIDSNIILLPYLFVAWKMPSVRKQIEENARTTNGTYKINQTVLSNIELIVPPLEKQNEFVSFVEQSDKSKLSVQNKLSAFRRLTYRILQFEGGLKNVQ